MRLYNLFNEFNDEGSKGNLLSKAKDIYSSLTKVEKVMVDYRIIINDLFPSYYMKLLISIYIIMERVNLSINNSYKMITLFQKLLLVESKDNIDSKNINSILELYENYKKNYIPFSSNCLNEFLKYKGYNLDYITEERDKIILYLREITKTNSVTRLEKYFIDNNNFMIHINFNNLYESLTNFKEEKKDSINYPEIDYNILINESNIFREELHNITISDKDKILENILKKKFPSSLNRSKIILKKILSHDYDISTQDIELSFELMRFIFGENSDKYINSILYKLKQRKIPPSIIISYDRDIGLKYISTEVKLEYILKECKDELFKNEISKYNISEIDLVTISKSFSNIEIFLYFINILKQLDINYNLYVQCFILEQLKTKIDMFVNLHHSIPNIEEILMEVKNEILIIYIERNKIIEIKKTLECVSDYNFNDTQISYAVGRSCNIDIFHLLYGNNIEGYNKGTLKNVILGCLSKGRTIFFKMLNHFVDDISNDDIISNIIKSFNISLFSLYISYIKIGDYDRYILDTIKNNNFLMFKCLVKLVNLKIENIDFIIINIIRLNRNDMLDIILENNNFTIEYILRIFEICFSYSSKVILNRLSAIISKKYNFNDPIIQKTKLRRIITSILNSNNNDLKDWFLEKVTVETPETKNKKIISHKQPDILYISSDDEVYIYEDDSDLEMDKI